MQTPSWNDRPVYQSKHLRIFSAFLHDTNIPMYLKWYYREENNSFTKDIVPCFVAPNAFQGQPPSLQEKIFLAQQKFSEISHSCQIFSALNCLHLLGPELVQWGISCLPSVNSLWAVKQLQWTSLPPCKLKATAAVTRGLKAGKCHTTAEVQWYQSTMWWNLKEKEKNPNKGKLHLILKLFHMSNVERVYTRKGVMKVNKCLHS